MMRLEAERLVTWMPQLEQASQPPDHICWLMRLVAEKKQLNEDQEAVLATVASRIDCSLLEVYSARLARDFKDVWLTPRTAG
jgi:hypothetical protein